MRKLMLVCVLALSACAHTRVESWKDNRMEVCNVKHADLGDLRRRAVKTGCGGAKLMETLTRRDGTVIKKGLFNGTHEMKAEFCAVYQCDSTSAQQ